MEFCSRSPPATIKPRRRCTFRSTGSCGRIAFCSSRDPSLPAFWSPASRQRCARACPGATRRRPMSSGWCATSAAAMTKKSRRRADVMVWFALPVLLAAVLGSSSPGARIYAESCASCHGAQQQGSADGPSLHHVGLAEVDFFLSTGRMPAAVPWIEVEHRDERAGQQLPLEQIRALEAFLAPV